MEEPPLDETAANSGATKKCAYCGKDNAETALVCDSCATPFPVTFSSISSQVSDAAASSPTEPPSLNARSATVIFLLSFAAQFGAAFIVGLGLGILSGSHGGASGPEQFSELAQKAMPWTALAAMLGMGVTVVAASVPRFGENLKDRAPTGAAWVVGSPRDIAA